MKVFRINDKPVDKLYKCMNFDIFLSKKKFLFVQTQMYAK